MMDSFVRGFIRSSLVWLGVGVLLGLSMAFWPAALAYAPRTCTPTSWASSA